MQLIKVSVIVPVFNAAKYIEACIQSILSQTLPEIELIIVNDGSTDNTCDIVEKFIVKDDRIKYIEQKNAGVSAARNAGIQAAAGEWIGFADADDKMEPAMLETLYKVAIDTEAEIAICNVEVFSKNGSSQTRLPLKEGVVEFNGITEKAVEDMMNFQYDYANWNKLYRREIIKEHCIRFEDHISIGEDLLFNLYYVHFIKRLVVVNQPLYQYRIHEESSMAKSDNKRLEQYNHQFNAYRQFSSKYGLTKEWEVFRRIMAGGFYNTLMPIIISNIKKQGKTRAASIALLCQTINTLNGELFYYPGKKTGLQGLKKMLLENRKYALFSTIVGIKHFFIL